MWADKSKLWRATHPHPFIFLNYYWVLQVIQHILYWWQQQPGCKVACVLQLINSRAHTSNQYLIWLRKVNWFRFKIPTDMSTILLSWCLFTYSMNFKICQKCRSKISSMFNYDCCKVYGIFLRSVLVEKCQQSLLCSAITVWRQAKSHFVLLLKVFNNFSSLQPPVFFVFQVHCEKAISSICWVIITRLSQNYDNIKFPQHQQ